MEELAVPDGDVVGAALREVVEGALAGQEATPRGPAATVLRLAEKVTARLGPRPS